MFIERTFVDPLPVAKRGVSRAEALSEASAAEIEFTPDGFFISRSGAHVFFRLRLNLDLADQELNFEKAPGDCSR